MKRPNDLLSSLWQATVERTDFYSKLILSVKEVVVMCKKIAGLGAVCLIITLLCCACADADKKTPEDLKTTDATTIVSQTAVSSDDTTSKTKDGEVMTTANTTTKPTQWMPRSKTIQRLRVEQVTEIKKDYLQWLKSMGITKNYHGQEMLLTDIDVNAYYGKYGSAEFLKIGYSGQTVDDWENTSTDIEGFTIPCGFTDGEIFYANHTFYSIQQAYERGILTKQDLCDLQEYRKYETTEY